MAHLPAVSGKETIRALERFGFKVIRITGSHHIMWKEGHPTVVPVPVHGRELPKGTLRSIIRQAGLTPAQFSKALR